jgi:hypothetical protein
MKAGIQAIIQKIGIDAKEHGDERYMQIKGETDEEIGGEVNLYLADLAKRRELLKKNNEHECERLLERLKSRQSRELLTYQHRLIDEIFELAAKKLREATKGEFLGMFSATLKGLKGSYELRLGEFSKGMLDEKDIKDICGADIEIKLAADVIPKKSGFVLWDENVEYNCLFEDIIEDKKNEQIAQVMREVFGDGQEI